MMLSCREATRLLSESMDHELPLGRRSALRFHLALCRFCRRYLAQVSFLRRVLRLSAEACDAAPAAPSVELPEAAKARIREAMRTSEAGE